MFRKVNVLIILLLLSLVSFEDPGKKDTRSLQATKLIKIGRHFSTIGKLESRDSLVKEGIIQLKAISDWEGLFTLYKWFLNEYEMQDKDLALTCAMEYCKLAEYHGLKEQMFYSCYLLSRLYFERNENDLAIEMGEKAVDHAMLQDNPQIKTLGYIIKANNEIETNKGSIAFDFLLKAKYEAAVIKDTALLIEAFNLIANFYEKVEDFEKAKLNRNNQLDLISQWSGFDSLTLMGEKVKLAFILNANKEFTTCDKLLYDLLSYSIRNNKKFLKENVFQAMRSLLLDRDDFKGFVKLYTESFPAEFDRVRNQKSHSYYKVMAYKCEYESNIDSARYYHELIKSDIIKKSTNKTIIGNTLRRIGQFYFRHQLLDSARANFELALYYLASCNHLPYKVDCSKSLDSIFVIKGDFRNAYYNKIVLYQLLDKKKQADHLINIQKREFEYKLNEDEHKAAEKRREHHKQLSEIYLAFGCIICMLFTIMLSFTSLNIHEKYVRLTGFVSFVFLFEFIILYVDEKIIDITSGNVLMSTLLKFSIALILYWLHHIVEKKTIKYILTHKITIINK